jgi:hypothetical protein
MTSFAQCISDFNDGSFGFEAVTEIFAQTDTETLSNSDRFDFHLTEDKGHGRNEVRAHFTTSASGLPMVSRWKGLQDGRDRHL